MAILDSIKRALGINQPQTQVPTIGKPKTEMIGVKIGPSATGAGYVTTQMPKYSNIPTVFGQSVTGGKQVTVGPTAPAYSGAGGSTADYESQWSQFHPGEGPRPVGYQGESGGPPANPQISRPGGFGSAEEPELSNTAKASEYLNYLKSQGYDTSGLSANQLSDAFNKGTLGNVISGLTQSGTSGTSVSPDAVQRAMSFGGGATGGTGASGSWGTSTGGTDFMSQLQQAVKPTLANMGKVAMGAIGRVIRPPEAAVAAETGGSQGNYNPFQKEENKNFLGLSRYGIGKTVENIGTALGLPEMFGGLSEKIAGGATPLTGSKPGTTYPTTGKALPPYPVKTGGPGGTYPSTTQTGGGGYGPVQYSNDPIMNDAISNFLTSAIQDAMSPTSQIEVPNWDADIASMRDEMGIPEMEATIRKVNDEINKVFDSIDSVDKDVQEIVDSGVLMTEGQRRNMVNKRLEPLRAQLSSLLRGAEKYGVAYEQVLKMLDQRMSAKQATYGAQMNAYQMQQGEEDKKFNRVLQLLPYMAQTQGTARKTTGGGAATSGSTWESEWG